ncbi:NAD+ diphosphatase [Stella humosa]|uniref:NAD(+) diphosphatase n=1 Tax=Stella humosa TaxID=94 RepID=A0A3N1LJM4_9PROT|nr:NAD(+) diphosphatase [Stella humosa]ROP91068.1 NAD+ diphosphatase [Stella humosa]BBK34582.1 NADH pyrophosphatase [Stella humosa]
MQRPNFYASNGLDRVSHLRRDAAWLAERLADPESRIQPVWRSQNFIARGEQPAAGWLPAGTFRDHVEAGATLALLGIHGGVAHFAVDLSAVDDPLELPGVAELGDFFDLRRVGPALAHAEGGMMAYARGILHWHSRHRFCGVCGSPTQSSEAGHQRRCTNPECKTSHFPRTDPAVIMLVHRGNRCLLGRQPQFPAGMHSTLAGFVEPGESLEDAVAREVKEETGIVVEDAIYHSSQPWPFPSSIMLGFHARAVSDEIMVDHNELESAAWFERDWILNHAADDTFRLPRPDSIARQLVEDWLKGAVPA